MTAHASEIRQDDDIVVTVCDLAREEPGHRAAVHWSVPGPIPDRPYVAHSLTSGSAWCGLSP